MDYTFRTVGLLGKIGDPNVTATLAHLATFLRRRRLRVLVDEASIDEPGAGRVIAGRRGQIPAGHPAADGRSGDGAGHAESPRAAPRGETS